TICSCIRRWIFAYSALRLDRRLGLAQEAERLAAAHPGVAPLPEGPEVVVVVHAGRIPHRVTESIVVPGGQGFPVRLSLPGLTDGGGGRRRVVVRAAGRAAEATAISLAAAARADLEQARARDMARLVARAVAKEAMARKARRDGGEVAGLLVRAVNIATEVADTRCWEALPAACHLARLPLGDAGGTVVVAADGAPVWQGRVSGPGPIHLVKVRLF
ncbi:MAG: hypothetical protein D6739_00620, partial [Nitrospirae bacterium]